jgi:hypothetical protein
MQVHLRARGLATCALAGVLAFAGCATSTPTGTASGGPPASASTAAAPTNAAATEAASTDPAVLILEDAGLETAMPAGTYTSRLFEPTLTIELGDGWFRRDSGDARRFNIRRGEDGGEDLTFVSGIDFIQCGEGDVVEAPDASTAVDLIFGMPELDTTQPEEVPVGDLVGTEIRLPGGGDGSLDDLENVLEHGCVISNGDAPFPADSAWVILLDSSVEQYVFVETPGGPVMIRARADESTTDVEALWDYMREVIGTVQLG